MSPLSLRRYRAERLLRADFERLRGTVLGLVQRRLHGAGMSVDGSDLDAAYSQAWHGLYAAMLEGQEIQSPGAWLATVTFRRVVDELRTRARDANNGDSLEEFGAVAMGGGPSRRSAVAEPDLASALDDRIRLRQLMEGLRSQLSGRELEAASLCYLQGLPRADAAARMGVSDAAMRRLMDGRRGRAGVAQKFGSLIGTIDAGRWCAEQGSLMRGLAYGILDPGGERYQLALTHHRECPACRSYVLSLRGLAAVLPPAPLLLRLALIGAGAAGVGPAGAGAGAGTGAAGATSAGGGAVGAASATGAAGGGWLIAGAGPAATKLAVGCLLALGVGAGCAALGGAGDRTHDVARTHTHAARASAHARAALVSSVGTSAAGGPTATATRGNVSSRTASPIASEQAPHEFGPETGVASGSPAAREARPPRAVTAGAASPRQARATVRTPSSTPSASSASAEPSATAAREFGPG